MATFYISLVLSMACVCSSAYEGQYIVTETKLGKFVGTTHSVSSLFNNDTRLVSRFLGIPYAKPPVGDLRFAKPVPYGELEFDYDASYYRAHCVQTINSYLYINENDYFQREDCLYLNIYKPAGDIKVDSNVKDRKLPVMVYIHGGSFADGGADIYDGDRLSAFHDVIVVVINYRLNIFGFLGDGSNMTGNYGLWDMKLALEWVHDYIDDFGGDNKTVTLFGNSAGGAAVLYQATQPTNKGLFQRVISQSGSIMAMWSYKRNPQKTFKETVQRLQCDKPAITETLQCLRALPMEYLMTYSWADFPPTVDGEFVQQSPLELINPITESAKQAIEFLTSLDLIIGSNDQDGALDYDYINALLDNNNSTSLNMSKEYISGTLASLFAHLTCAHIEPMTLFSSIIDLYSLTDTVNSTDALLERLIEIDTDVEFFVPSVLTANIFISNANYYNSSNNIYMYMFSQKPDFAPYPRSVTGAMHFMEMPYVLGLSLSFKEKLNLDFEGNYPIGISNKDIMLAETMMKLWSNFAKTGNPNSDVSAGEDNMFIAYWPRYAESSYLYLDIRHDHTSFRSINDYPSTSRVHNVLALYQDIENMCAYNQDLNSTESTQQSTDMNTSSISYSAILIFFLSLYIFIIITFLVIYILFKTCTRHNHVI